MIIFPKDPSSNVDFSIDWGEWLTAGEAITATSWAIEPSTGSAPVLGVETSSGTVRGIYVSGGQAGHRFKLTCHIQTDANRSADRSLTLRLMEQ